MRNLKNVLVLVAVLAIALVTAIACGATTEDSPTPTPESSSANTPQGGISVSGTASISLAPDTATIVLGVEALHETVAQARADAAAAMTNIVDVLTAAGVVDDDIQTQHLSIQPQYDYSDETRELIGFHRSQHRQRHHPGHRLRRCRHRPDCRRWWRPHPRPVYLLLRRRHFLLRRSAHRGGRAGRHHQGPTPRRPHRRHPRQTPLHQLRRRHPLPRLRSLISHRNGRIRRLRHPHQRRRSRDISHHKHHLCHRIKLTPPPTCFLKKTGRLLSNRPVFLSKSL